MVIDNIYINARLRIRRKRSKQLLGIILIIGKSMYYYYYPHDVGNNGTGGETSEDRV